MSEPLINRGLTNTLKDFAEYAGEIAVHARAKAKRLKAQFDAGEIEGDEVEHLIERLNRIAVAGVGIDTMIEALTQKTETEQAEGVLAVAA